MTEPTDFIPLNKINDIIAQSTAISRKEESKNIAKDRNKRRKFYFGGFLTLITGLMFTLFLAITTENHQKIEEIFDMKPSELLISRNKWVIDLGRVGSTPLKTPVKKVIFIETIVKKLCKKDACGLNVLKENFYPCFEDLKENFVLGIDGTILEGRGFTREGEIFFDEYGTNYNNHAISENDSFKLISKFLKVQLFQA